MKDALRTIPRKHIVILLFIALFVLFKGVSALSGCGGKKLAIPVVTRVDKRFALYQFLDSYSREAPMRGVAYYHQGPGILTVLQSLPGGVLATSDTRSFEGVFMITSREYVDNAFLANGYYVYVGMYTYQTLQGVTKKVHCFAEVPYEVLKKQLSRAEKKK